MHITSDYYRQRGANRIELPAAHPDQPEPSLRLSQGATQPAPLRPSADTVARLARLHLAQFHSHQVS